MKRGSSGESGKGRHERGKGGCVREKALGWEMPFWSEKESGTLIKLHKKGTFHSWRNQKKIGLRLLKEQTGKVKIDE